MAEEENSTAQKVLGKTDNLFSRFGGYLVERISAFVSFLFLLFGFGMIYGRFIVMRFPQIELFLLAAPFVIALIAYYNRFFAIISFIFLVLLFVL